MSILASICLIAGIFLIAACVVEKRPWWVSFLGGGFLGLYTSLVWEFA